MIEHFANKKDPETDGKLRYKQSIAKKLVEMAAAGDIKFMTEYFDRTVGRPRQSVEHEGGVDIRVTIDWRDGRNSTEDQPSVPEGDPKSETV